MRRDMTVPFLGILSVLLLVLVGCPFESKMPLQGPIAGSLDPSLLGAWIGVDEDEDDSLRVFVYAFNDAEYYIETVGENDDVERYRAYLVPVAGARLLQINELSIEPAPGGYIFARYDAAGEKLRIRIVGEDAVPESLTTDPVGLREFIAAHWGDPALEDPDWQLDLFRYVN